MEMQNYTAILENSIEIFYKVKYTLDIGPNTSIPRYLPKEMKANIHTQTSNQVFLAALCITETRKNPNDHQLVNGKISYGRSMQ